MEVELEEVPMPEIKSSNIKWVQFNPETQELDVTFRSGETYRYAPVKQGLYDELLASPSKGGFVNQRLRRLNPQRLKPSQSGKGVPE